MKFKVLVVWCLLFGAVLARDPLYAQTNQRITIKMLDSKTGKPITTSEFMVWSNREFGPNVIWVKQNKDGVGELSPSPSVNLIALRALYGPANWSYVNCDSVKFWGRRPEPWYPVSDIIAKGIAAPNYCNDKKATAKPGEFVFFVREMTFWEKMKE